jgi:hypothetical protein
MRLNVSALVNEETVGKFLVVVGEEAGMDQLVDKLQRTLRRGGISSTVERVLNSSKAVLPHDEFLGDMLRDGEEIFVVLRGQDGRLLSESAAQRPQEASPSHFSAVMVPEQCTQVQGNVVPMTVELNTSQLQQLAGLDESDEEDDVEEALPVVADYPPPPASLRANMGSMRHVPGPSENFETERMPFDVLQVDHPSQPIQPATYDNDWLVESLTPHLRDFVLHHFHEEFITEPKYVSSIGKFVGPRFYQASGSFISIFMRPHTAVGSDPSSTMPVHYNIAKHDLQTFQRKAEAHIDRAQQHVELFSATMVRLQALLQKGMAETDHISEMLPHSYQALDEVGGAMMEVDRPIFPKMEGSNPIIIVDTSGAVGENLLNVKAALKRALFTHTVGKNSFQLIRFQASTGEPRLWMQGMAATTEENFSSAEVWIDNLAPVSNARLVNGIRYAMAHQDCDCIYLLSSADVDRSQHDAILASIRHLNTREVQINTIGVEPHHLGELLLRNISESNHGDFLLRFFKGQSGAPAYCTHDKEWTSWRTNAVNEKSKQLSDSFKKPKMSIGSQVRIIEVMQREEKQKEESWREEWKCTQRLLLAAESSSKKHGTVMSDRDMVKELERKSGRTQLARVGGGFMYHTEELDLGLERLFQHQSAVTWTANTDSAATGPKVPCGGAGQARLAKFPPSQDMLPESVLPMPERRVRPRSAGYASNQQGLRRGPPPLSTGSNPWAASSPLDKTKRQGGPPTPGARKAANGGVRAPSPGRGSRGPSPVRSRRSPSPVGPRAASADRAAGDRQASPHHATASKKGRGPATSRDQRGSFGKAYTHTLTSQPPSPSRKGQMLPALVSTAPIAPEPLLPQPRLERRWSF